MNEYERLSRLFADAHPGLFTWRKAVVELLGQIGFSPTAELDRVIAERLVEKARVHLDACAVLDCAECESAARTILPHAKVPA